MNARNAAALALIALFFPLCAAAEKPCTTEPRSKWMDRRSVRAKIESLGYKIVDFEVEHGCYAIEVRDKDGRELDLFLNPVDAKIVRQEQG